MTGRDPQNDSGIGVYVFQIFSSFSFSSSDFLRLEFILPIGVNLLSRKRRGKRGGRVVVWVLFFTFWGPG